MNRKTLILMLIISAIFNGISACDCGNKKNGQLNNLLLMGLLSGGQTGVVDVSHDGTSGETVAPTVTPGPGGTLITAENQEKRYQTFVADCHTNITGVTIKIRKKSGSQTYANLTVDLYDTDIRSQPSTKLAGATVDATKIGTDFDVIMADLRYQGLVPGTKYAIVLGQVVSALALNDGYEWCVKEVSAKLNFGTLQGSSKIVEDWLGDGWLIVYVSGGNCPSNTSSCAPKDTSGSVSKDGSPISTVADNVDGGAYAVSVYAAGVTEIILCFDSSCNEEIIVTVPGQSTGIFSNHTLTTQHFTYTDYINKYSVTSAQEKGCTNGSIIITQYDTCYVSGSFSGLAKDEPLADVVNLTSGSFKAYRVTPPSQTYAIGSAGPAGGLVFYDKGGYTNGWRYLEAAPSSTEWTGKAWKDPTSFISGTEATINSGVSNTAAIVEALNSVHQSDRAAQLCNDLNYGGHCDWFLPSKDALYLMYDNLKVSGLGNFGNASYWSSTMNGSNNVCDKNFLDGTYEDPLENVNTLRVRAIRAF